MVPYVLGRMLIFPSLIQTSFAQRNRASLADKARASRALLVAEKLAGKWLASMAAPKCCWQSAARAVLNTPLGPQLGFHGKIAPLLPGAIDQDNIAHNPSREIRHRDL